MNCPLHIASYALRIGVSVTELQGSEFVISHTFQRKRYISIAGTGSFIMYALGPFSRKRSHFIMCHPMNVNGEGYKQYNSQAHILHILTLNKK